MNLNELRDKAYKCACEHGFHNAEYSNEHYLMLTIGEVAEMIEAERKDYYPNVNDFIKSDTVNDIDFKDKFERFIKNTVWDECADVVIRLLDLSGLRGYDLEVKSYCDFDFKYVNKSTLSQLGFKACELLTDSMLRNSKKVRTVINLMFMVAEKNKVDLMWFIEQKMRYNQLRPYLNGKLY